MKHIKMIVSDLDMTALRTDKSISQYTENIFSKCIQHGIVTAIATARYYIDTESYIKILKPDYNITTDGAMIYKNDKFIYGTGFGLAATNSIIGEILRINAHAEITVATKRRAYWNRKNIFEPSILGKAEYNDYSSPLKESAYEIVAELPNKSFADTIGSKYNCKIVCYRGERSYGFISPNSGKIQSIRYLAEMLNIQMADIIAFGDDLNDIEMLKECGYGVAVENAIGEVKDAAEYICGSNDNDGVAKYIERYVLHDL